MLGERIVYYEEYVVVDPGNTDLVEKQLLNDSEISEAIEKWGEGSFVAKIGGEAIFDLLKNANLNNLVIEILHK